MRLDSVTSIATSQTGSEGSKELPPTQAPAPATPMSDGKGKEREERDDAPVPTDDDDDETPEEKKLYARMEAKIRRMCTPSPTTGKTTASPQLLAVEEQGVHPYPTREVDDRGFRRQGSESERARARGTERERVRDRERQRERRRGGATEKTCSEAVFQTKLESWRLTEQFRKVQTRGGWYSEQDMKKPVSEGGLAYSAYFCCINRKPCTTHSHMSAGM